MPDVEQFYGVSVVWNAGCESQGDSVIRITESPSRLFDGSAVYHRWEEKEGNSWLVAGRLPDGSFCLRFDDAEFQLSPGGSCVKYFMLPGCPSISPRHYFINTVLPLILNLRGTEALHASSVLVGDSALAFVGNGGFGKSTFAAAMVKAGHQLLSDDAVVLLPSAGEIRTPSGPAEMNLYPHARSFLRPESQVSGKAKVKLGQREYASGTFPLRRLYFLEPSDTSSTCRAAAFSGGELVLALVRAAHRLDIEDPDMLARQLETLKAVASSVPARRLSFPAGMADATVMAEAVTRDLELKTPLAQGTR